MRIDLTQGQSYALQSFFGYLIMTPDGGYIDTYENTVIFYGPVGPLEHNLPRGCKFVEDTENGEDHWKVQIWDVEQGKYVTAERFDAERMKPCKLSVSDHDIFNLSQACMTLDKLQVELHEDTPYEIPSTDQIRKRILKAMDYLEELPFL